MKNATKAQRIAKSFFRTTTPKNTSVEDWREAVRLIVGCVAIATRVPAADLAGVANEGACTGHSMADYTALLLCESIVDDGKTSTLNRLQAGVTTPSLPHTCSNLWAFIRIADCHDPVTLVLEVAGPTSDELYSVNDALVTPNEDGVVTWCCNLEGLELTEPGKHMFTLEADGIRIGVCWYEVVVPPPGEAEQA